MTAQSLGKPDITALMKLLCEEVEYRRLNAPTTVAGGAVWADRAGKLTGDLFTTSGPVSFRNATLGQSIPPDPQLSIPWPSCADLLRPVKERITSFLEFEDMEAALNGIVAIRAQLAECLEFTEGNIAHLSTRLELGDLSGPDDDFVPSIRGIVARHVPDDSPLTCDPDERPTE